MAVAVVLGIRRPRWWSSRQRHRGPEGALTVAAVFGWALLMAHQVASSVGVPLIDAVVGSEPAYLHNDQAPLALTVAAHGLMWVAMIAATMLPSINGNLRFVALRCPRRFRRAMIIDIVAGWVAAWSVAAALLAGSAWLLVHGVGALPAIAMAFAIAVVWQLTARKRLSLARCHRTMAPPLERRSARLIGRRFGLALGTECAVSCWALMLTMAVLHHHLLAVVPLAAVSWYERMRPHAQLRQHVTASAVAAVGLVTVSALAVL